MFLLSKRAERIAALTSQAARRLLLSSKELALVRENPLLIYNDLPLVLENFSLVPKDLIELDLISNDSLLVLHDRLLIRECRVPCH